MGSLQGKLLIAAPQLLDPNFVRTVTLLVRHDPEGALGLVLNRPTNTSLSDIWDQIAPTPLGKDRVLFYGGPCQGPLMLLHGRPDEADHEVLPGVFFTVERDKAQRLLEEGADPLLCFIGYSGWGKGQLEGELKTGSWLVAPATPERVFAGRPTLWQELARTAMARILFPGLSERLVPRDPALN